MTPDETALLAAVCAAPEDDAPRLVMADWFDEHGDPERAEFIRVQIQLAGCKVCDGTGKDFVPFGVGYVELPGELKVETHLTESDPEGLSIGIEMELVVVPFRTDDDGNEVVTFAFRPVN